MLLLTAVTVLVTVFLVMFELSPDLDLNCVVCLTELREVLALDGLEAAELVMDVDEVDLEDPANDIAVLALAPPKKGRKN